MSQHPSLKSGTKGKVHRSVWKRFERLKHLAEKDKWTEGDSIFGLPKMKLLKLKIKKEKPAEALTEGVVGAEGAPATGAEAAAGEKGKAAAPSSEAAQAKGTAGKEAPKVMAKPEKKPEKK